MQLYNINNDNTLDAQSLHERQKLDPVTFYDIAENQVIADADLPSISDNQAYFVSGQRNSDGHYAVSANVSVIADYRNQTAYNKATKEQVQITELGDIDDALTLLVPATQHDEFVGAAWTLTDSGKEKQFDDAKTKKHNEASRAAQDYVNAVVEAHKTPQFERQTWTIQAQEAYAWHADNSAPTPNLDRIAASRGIPADILKAKAYQKAAHYQALTSIVAGQRQKIEDAIDAAATIEELEAIEIIYEVPGA